MRKAVTVLDLAHFEAAFGELGLEVGPRTGTNRRTQDDEEWYSVRRFLKLALRSSMFGLPITVHRECPPRPDFSLEWADKTAFVEITEATISSDQQEFTLSERSEDDCTLLGEFGGRFVDGATGDGAERVWVADILRAVRRKRKKAICLMPDSECHLVVWPNSRGCR